MVKYSSRGTEKSAVLPAEASLDFLLSICSVIPSGILNLPAVALGIITGGFALKRFKLGVVGAARMSIAASLGSFVLLCVQAFLHCDNAQVAGLTVSYQGWVAHLKRFLFGKVSKWNVRIKTSLLLILRIFLMRVCLRQGSSCVLQSSDSTVTMQQWLLLLDEALGPSVCLQRHDLRFSLPGWL